MASLGYTYLVEQYSLDARPAKLHAVIDSSVRGHKLQQDTLAFEPSYQPEDTLAGHLQFALRYEGINLEILALLFDQAGEAELTAWLNASPTSAYARRAGFLYEWLTEKSLPIEAIAPRERFVPLVDKKLQICLSGDDLPANARNRKFRVLNNLLGNRDFCPMVRLTPRLKAMMQVDLKGKVSNTLAKYDTALLRRATNYLLLKETQSSYEIERESPSPDREQRFIDLLRNAETNQPLTEERLAELQRAVLDPLFHEFGWRGKQNWLGREYGQHRQVDYVPPRPENLVSLMAGLLALAEQTASMFKEEFEATSTARHGAGNHGISKAEVQAKKRMAEQGHAANSNAIQARSSLDPVILTALISFGFVFMHPFMDGNGRIHRYLIHEVLIRTGFTPRGFILPVSAVILANIDEYIAALEDFSRPMITRTKFIPELPDIPAKGNDALYFRYFDATRQVEFLYWALKRTVEDDMEAEIKYLLGFDRAYTALNSMTDWPAHSRDLFINVVRQNDGKLSARKRKSHFTWMKDDEVAEAERRVIEAFGPI